MRGSAGWCVGVFGRLRWNPKETPLMTLRLSLVIALTLLTGCYYQQAIEPNGGGGGPACYSAFIPNFRCPNRTADA